MKAPDEGRARELTDEGRPLVLGEGIVGGWETGDDLVARVKLALLKGRF